MRLPRGTPALRRAAEVHRLRAPAGNGLDLLHEPLEVGTVHAVDPHAELSHARLALHLLDPVHTGAPQQPDDRIEIGEGDPDPQLTHPPTVGSRVVSDPRPGTDRPIHIAPSVLPADFSRLGEEVIALEKAGVDRIQWDVMDGRFVPNLTFGPDVIASTRSLVNVPFEAHLMVEEPDLLAARYVEAGCELVIVHAEACRHLHRTLGNLAELGAKPAVALNPATPAIAVRHVLDLVEMVLVMTVNPGFGGQAYLPTMEPKVAEIRRWIVEGGYDVDLEVDGGVSPSTAAGAAAAGANVLVAGSALFRDPEGLEHATAEIRSVGEAAARPA